jgi:translation initiation factor IF-3
VIGPDGKMLGVMSTREALRLAESLGLDLVEVSPNVRPPVVKILDYGKFLYEEKKRRREARKNADAVKLRGGEVKELNFSATIDNHDLQVKSRKARDLLEDGYKVRIRIYFKGRQIAHAEVGRSAMDRMIESLMDIGEVEQPPRMEGRNLIAVIRPLSKKKRKSSQEQRTKEES